MDMLLMSIFWCYAGYKTLGQTVNVKLILKIKFKIKKKHALKNAFKTLKKRLKKCPLCSVSYIQCDFNGLASKS